MPDTFVVTPDFIQSLTSRDPRIQLFLARNQFSLLQSLPIWDLLSADERLFLRHFNQRKPIAVCTNHVFNTRRVRHPSGSVESNGGSGE